MNEGAVRKLDEIIPPELRGLERTVYALASIWSGRQRSHTWVFQGANSEAPYFIYPEGGQGGLAIEEPESSHRAAFNKLVQEGYLVRTWLCAPRIDGLSRPISVYAMEAIGDVTCVGGARGQNNVAVISHTYTDLRRWGTIFNELSSIFRFLPDSPVYARAVKMGLVEQGLSVQG